MKRALVISALVCLALRVSIPALAWSTFWDGEGVPSGWTSSGSGGVTIDLEGINKGFRMEDTVTSGGHNYYYRSTTTTTGVTIGTKFKVESYSIPTDGTGRICFFTMQAGSSPSPRLSVAIVRVGSEDRFVLLNLANGSVLHNIAPVDDQWHEVGLYIRKSDSAYQLWWENISVKSGTAVTSSTSSTRQFGASTNEGCTGTSTILFDYNGYNTGVFVPEKNPPNPGTASSPQYTSGPITVSYTGASDTSRIHKVYLWYRKDSGPWKYHGSRQSTLSYGDIAFDFPDGYGTYYFRTQAQDRNGNYSPEPSGDQYDDSTIYQQTVTYNCSNGYVSFHGDSGEIRNLSVDPTGSGNYRLVAKQVFLGELCPLGGQIGYDWEDNVLALNSVSAYTKSSEISVTSRENPVRLYTGQTLGQLFTAPDGMACISVNSPTWYTTGSAMTIKVFRGGIGGTLLAQKRCLNVADNSWQSVYFAPQAAGDYYIELSEASGTVGWWTANTGTVGQMYANGVPVGPGSRCFTATMYSSQKVKLTITLNGPQVTTQISPTGSWKWRMITPWERNGYELEDPDKIPFRRFFSDKGGYMPAAQLKRRDTVNGQSATQWFHFTGNAEADLRIVSPNSSPVFAMEPEDMLITLGTALSFTVMANSDFVPDFYPAFYTSDPAFDRVLNEFLYDRTFSWGIGGVAADWFEWTALINYWMARPGLHDHWRSNLLTYPVDEEGYVHSWGNQKGWPFPDNTIYDTRHFTTNPNFILGSWRYYCWTRDRAFLVSNAERLRRAMNFQLTQLEGSTGILRLPDKDHGGTPADLGSNYWDDIPFGGRSAYENAYYYASLLAMAEIEEVLGDSAAASSYKTLAATCRQRYNELFWNDTSGRFIACIDENGVRRDFGFTYVNMEAATYGLADQARVERIFFWMENAITSSGKVDTYSRYQFAPRANTIDCRNWWYLNGTGEIPAQNYDAHLENGGAILYTSGYDLMARAKYLGADNAFARLQAILARYQEPDRLAGGAPLYRGENNGWQVGTDVPFPESGIVPASFLYAFIGVEATAKGLTIKPNVPSSLSFAGVRNLRYQGMMLDIRVTNTSVKIVCNDPGKEFVVEETIPPGGIYTLGEDIKGLKSWPDGTSVTLEGKVLYLNAGTYGYVQERDRSSGIRIEGSLSAGVDRIVDIIGVLGTTSDGERYIQITTLGMGDEESPEPLAIISREVGGSAVGLQPGISAGLTNVGLLVTVFGRVTAKAAGCFYVDDGSAVDEGDPLVKGVRIAAEYPGDVGDFVKVTGASSMLTVNGLQVRLIHPRDAGDIVTMIPQA